MLRLNRVADDAVTLLGFAEDVAHTLEGVEKKLSADASYRAEFEKAYGPGPVSYEKVEKAIASFECTVNSGNSPFDRFLYGGNKKAMSPAAIVVLLCYK